MTAETLDNPIRARYAGNPISRLFRYYWGANIVERIHIMFCFVLAFVFTGFLEFIGARTLIIIYAYLGIYVLGLLICTVKDRGFWARAKYVHILALFLTLYHVWGMLVLDDKMSMAFEAFRSYAREIVTVYAVSTALSNKKELRILANGLQIGLILNAIVSLLGFRYPFVYAHFVLDPKMAADVENVGRYSGVFSNPNAASYVFMGCLFFSKWANPKLSFVSRIFGLIALYLTFSRTSQYMLLLSLVLNVVRNMALQWQAADYQRVAATFFKAGTFVSIIVILMLVNWDTLSHNPKFQRFENISDQRRGYRGRFGVLADALAKVQSGPWYGRGFFQFKEGISQIRPGVYVGAHNTYVLILGEIGWPNMLIYIGTMLYALRRSWKTIPDPDDRYYVTRYVVYVMVVSAFWHNLLIHLHGVLMVTFIHYVPYLFRGEKRKRQRAVAPAIPPDASAPGIPATE